MVESGQKEEEIDPDQYVQFIASPPRQINIAIPSPGFENTPPSKVKSAERHLPGVDVLNRYGCW